MIFIDTAAFVARHDHSDKHHKAARPVWRSIERRGVPLVTTNYVLSETVTLLTRALDAVRAAELGRRLVSPTRVELVRVSQAEEFRALGLLESLDIEDLSFTDVTSFAVMRRRGITTAFTFDGDFIAAGFSVVPGR